VIALHLLEFSIRFIYLIYFIIPVKIVFYKIEKEGEKKMFKGKFSTLKNIIYLIILELHSFLFAYFIYTTLPDYVITITSSLSIASLIILGLYSFLTTKSYYFYFYIGIIISSVPLMFILYLSAILIVPELIVLFILLLNGQEQGSVYYKMRVNKKANLFQHDPAITNFFSSGLSKTLMFRMEEVWNPDSSIPLKSENKRLEKITFSVKMQLLCFILTSVSFISFMIYVSRFYIIF
jgi:hypothetical protein